MPYDDKIVLQGFARSIIRRKARLIARCDGFTAQDLRDIEQELRLRLLQGLPQFDPTLSHINVFVTTVIERSVAMLIRDRWAQKRDSSDKVPQDSPLAATELPDSDSGLDIEEFDRDHDLAQVLATLPVDLRDLAELLKVKTVSQAARDQNVPRTTVQREVNRLRKRFEDAGLRIYF